jgi:phosphoribosylformylglycinamidine synthase I
MKPKALILLAYGTNRDPDVAEALTLAGADPQIVPLNLLRQRKKAWVDYQILVLAGGFSYADALGAGKLLAIELQSYFVAEMEAFIESGKAVIGICNGFQALLKTGIFSAEKVSQQQTNATLTFNASGHFECRWVTLKAVSQACIWTQGITGLIECPVAHGEGNLQGRDPSILELFQQRDQIALTYVQLDGSAAEGKYPFNPNGSQLDIAGLTNPRGNVLGLMPHPENHIHVFQHPRWTRGMPDSQTTSGLLLFKNAVRYTEER